MPRDRSRYRQLGHKTRALGLLGRLLLAAGLLASALFLGAFLGSLLLGFTFLGHSLLLHKGFWKATTADTHRRAVWALPLLIATTPR